MEKRRDEKKEKIQNILIIVQIILLLITLLMIFLDIRATRNGCDILNEKKISNSQTKTDIPIRETKEDGYTELIGYGLLEIDKDYPYLYLQNKENNDVYMSFEVIYDNNILYESDLVEPGMMERFDVYSCLNAGQHTLTYSISTYDMTSKEVLWSGIQQKQDILIRK